MTASARRSIAALFVGATIGATTAAGTALLLYTGQGFLRAVGLLISSTIMAVAAGVWAGAPEATASTARPPATRARWYGLLFGLLAGGIFTAVWQSRAALRDVGFGGALAVLFVLALPAYAAGALLAGIHARDQHGAPPGAGSGIAATALAGAGFGVLLATTVLIQNLEPYGIYYGAAALLALLAQLEQRTPAEGSDGMKDHVALITGVGRSGQLGFTIAQRFLAAGARVVITDVRGDVDALAGELGDSEVVAAVRADLTSDDDLGMLLAAVRERFGRLDSVVNAVGGLTVMKRLEETTSEEWQRELQRNAETVLRVSRAALPLLRESRGAIINFAAPAGERAVAGLGAYSAAKAAVIALTRALALEEKSHGVRVNAIAPGTMDTAANRQNMPDADAFVSRDDVAAVVLFLASDDARAVSGETIHVAGPTLA